MLVVLLENTEISRSNCKVKNTQQTVYLVVLDKCDRPFFKNTRTISVPIRSKTKSSFICQVLDGVSDFVFVNACWFHHRFNYVLSRVLFASTEKKLKSQNQKTFLDNDYTLSLRTWSFSRQYKVDHCFFTDLRRVILEFKFCKTFSFWHFNFFITFRIFTSLYLGLF